jgi:DNA-binding ferritin-like protein
MNSLVNFYEEIHASIDTTAEEIRKLGDFAPGSLSRYSELTVIPDEDNNSRNKCNVP